MTAIAPKRVISEGEHQLNPPFEGLPDDRLFLCGNCHKEFLGMLVLAGINAVITYHFEVFVGNVNNEPLDKINGGNVFDDELAVLVAVVMKSHGSAVIVVNTGCCNDGTSQISADVFDNVLVIVQRGFSVDVEAVLAVFVDVGFNFFERFSNTCFHMVEKRGLEGFAEEKIVEMFDFTPNSVVSNAALGKQNVYVRIPFEVSSESMQNRYESGFEVFRLVHIEKHSVDHVANGEKQAV